MKPKHQLFIPSEERASDVRILRLFGFTPRFSQLIQERRAVRSAIKYLNIIDVSITQQNLSFFF